MSDQNLCIASSSRARVDLEYQSSMNSRSLSSACLTTCFSIGPTRFCLMAPNASWGSWPRVRAISTASASMMTEALRGKTLDEVNAIFAAYHELVTGRCVELNPPPPVLGKLVVFAGVREFPMRVKCATLAWHTLRAALDRQSEPVSTE